MSSCVASASAGALLCLLPLSALASQPPTPSQVDVHVVREGEILGAIALKHHCSLAELKRLNGLASDLIKVGQKLKLPAPPEREPAKAKAKANANAKPARAAEKATEKKKEKAERFNRVVHTVESGETLGGIAARYKTKVAHIRADNRLKRDLITVGQKLSVRVEGQPVLDRRHFVYVVQPGDTLGEIAAEYGMDWREIGALNGWPNPDLVRVGDKLNLYLPPPEVDSETVGRTNGGRLVAGEQLPAGPGYKRRRPHRAWGTNETITHILAVIAEVRRKHPGARDLLIGDLSAKKGGKLPPHKSHQSGRDADIGYYFKSAGPDDREAPPRFWRVANHPDKVDYEASWSLIQALVGTDERSSRVKHIFMSYNVQKIFYDWAKAKGVPTKVLEHTFQYPRGKRALRGKIRHVRGHVGHMHVRFKCPKDDTACVI